MHCSLSLSYTLFHTMNEITKITRLLFDRPTLMNFKTQDQKVSPRYGRIKKKDEKSRRWHGIFCTGRESKNYAGKWFHILAVGNTVIIFVDVTSCALRAYWLNYGWYHYHKNTPGRNCIFCHRDEHYFLCNLKSSISFLELKSVSFSNFFFAWKKQGRHKRDIRIIGKMLGKIDNIFNDISIILKINETTDFILNEI